MATKLASGYIELTVKKAGDAMKEITAEITGIEKDAKKSGEAAGKAINDGLTKGAKGAGKAIGDEITSGAEKAGKDAGDAISDGVTAGAKKAGKAVQDEITSATKKAGDEASKTKIEPKVDTKPARDSIIKDIGGGIIEAARQGAKDAGVDLDKWAVEQAGKLGKAIGDTIGESSVGHWIQDASRAIQDFRDSYISPAVDGLQHLGDAFKAIQDHDPTGALNGVAGALKSVGQNDAAKSVGEFATTVDGHMSTFNSFNGVLQQAVGLLGQIAPAAAAAAGPWATIVAAGSAGGVAIGQQIQQAQDRHEANAFAGINDKDRQYAISHGLPVPQPIAPVQQLNNVPQLPPTQQQAQRGLDLVLPPELRLPKHAKGGVTKSGRIYGPGTGTSDSILGVGADGVPTALVSNGEGVVRKSAMDRGGAAIVDALNRGGKLPHFDEGGQVPKPDPMMQRWIAAVQAGRISPNGELLGGGAKGGEGGLQANTVRGRRLMSALFPELTDIGGVRQDSLKWHPSGLALDLMIPGQGGNNTPTTKEGLALGNQINAFIKGNAGALGSDYTMWQEKDHYNHIHANFGASGMPGKDQKYFVPPELMAQMQAAMAAQQGGGAPVGGGGAPNMSAMMLGLADGQQGADLAMAGTPANSPTRTEGYIPAGAGASGQAGTSFASGLYMMAASAINQGIDQAASAASSAAGMGANMFAPGTGGMASGAASTAIGLGTDIAKKGVNYGFQMAGIFTDAAAEILMPFGVPRWLSTDPTSFIPQMPGQSTAVTTGEKAQEAQTNPAAAAQPGQQPGGPVQPGQLPGQQTISSPVQQATPGSIIAPEAPPIQAPAPSGPVTPAPSGPAAPAVQPSLPPVSPAPNPNQTGQSAAAAIAKTTGPMAQKPPQDPMDWWKKQMYGQSKGGIVGVYDNGGILPPGAVAINKSKRPEPMAVFTGQQWGTLQALANNEVAAPDPAAMGGTNDYSVRIDNVTVKDVNEMQREIDSRQRLQMMRYAGRP
jgi:hypothetical protein